MRILLPPSETKRSGGGKSVLTLAEFDEPELNSARDAVINQLAALASKPRSAAKILKLSVKQLDYLEDDKNLRNSQTMPAIERYTGVLYDALDAPSLDGSQREWLNRHVQIQSSLFGRVAATDLIPTYRLSASTALPGLKIARKPYSLKTFWQSAHRDATEAADREHFVLDLRSKDYVALDPTAGTRGEVSWLNIVARSDDGVVRALNHFNKAAKGRLVRLFAETQPEIESRLDFLDWATTAGIEFEVESNGSISIVADSVKLEAGSL